MDKQDDANGNRGQNKIWRPNNYPSITKWYNQKKKKLIYTKANVAVKSFKFLLVAVYGPNITAERFSFFRRLAPFLDNTKRLVLKGDCNAILDPKIDKVGRGARRLRRCESCLVDVKSRYDLVDRFRLDHLGREIWTWLDSSPSVKVGSYLDRVFVRRADIDFVSCSTFHLIAWTDLNLLGSVCG